MLFTVLAACFVTDAELRAALDRDGDGYLPVLSGGVDCNEGRSDIHPGADEVCGDGIDNNCDGVPDDRGVGEREWYRDDDGDNFGVDETTMACTRPEGFAPEPGDCDDSDSAFRPGVGDQDCDGLDQDCDGIADDEIPLVVRFQDADNDGFGNEAETTVTCLEVPGYVNNSLDCDDTNDGISPAAEDFCDGIDQDCDGVIDDDTIFIQVFPDADGDGYGVESGATTACEIAVGFAGQTGDCDDNDGSVNPQAIDLCDGVDQNCDFIIDDDSDFVLYFQDGDNDGVGIADVAIESCTPVAGFAPLDGDCDDDDADISPLVEDYCDGLDQDCDLTIDEDAVRTLYFEDGDGDGVGSDISVEACAAPAGFVLLFGDCDDTTPGIQPGLEDFCDGLDQDCDGQADEDAVFTTWFRDADGDGLGRVNNPQSTCDGSPSGYVASAGDCNDNNPSVLIPAWYPDLDGDGAGFGSPVGACTSPPGHSATSDDCDDGDVRRYPSNLEVCGTLVDEDCDENTDCRWPQQIHLETEADLVLTLPVDVRSIERIGDAVGDSRSDWLLHYNDSRVAIVAGGDSVDLNSPQGGTRLCDSYGLADLTGDGKQDLACWVLGSISVYPGGSVLGATALMSVSADRTFALVESSRIGAGIWMEDDGAHFKMYEVGAFDVADAEIRINLTGGEAQVFPSCVGTVHACLAVQDGDEAHFFRNLNSGVYGASDAFWTLAASPPLILVVVPTWDYSEDGVDDLLLAYVDPADPTVLAGFGVYATPIGAGSELPDPLGFVDPVYSITTTPDGVGDFDGDGLRDYVGTDFQGSFQVFYGGEGLVGPYPDTVAYESGTLIPGPIFGFEPFEQAVFGHWNDDGRLDFVLVDEPQGAAYVVFGTGI